MSRRPLTWLVLLTALAVALGGSVWWFGSAGRHVAGAGTGVGAGAGRAAVLSAVPSTPADGSARRSDTGSDAGFAAGFAAGAPARVGPAVDVLREWDMARAAAYAAGDVAALRSLYVAGSSAATADARMLRGYLRRGLRVEGIRMQLLAVDVQSRSPHRLRLRVTDRLTGAVAVGEQGRLRLPRDQATTRVVTLRRVGPSWKVATVR